MARQDLLVGIKYYVQSVGVYSDVRRTLIAKLNAHQGQEVHQPTDAKLVFVFPPRQAGQFRIDQEASRSFEECQQGSPSEWSYDDLCDHLARGGGGFNGTTYVVRSEWVKDCVDANKYLRGDRWNRREILKLKPTPVTEREAPLVSSETTSPASSTTPIVAATEVTLINQVAHQTLSVSARSTPGLITAGPLRIDDHPQTPIIAPASPSTTHPKIFEKFVQDPDNFRTFHLAVIHEQYRKMLLRAIVMHGGIIDPLDEAQIVIFDTTDDGAAIDQEALAQIKRWQVPISAGWVNDSLEHMTAQGFAPYRLVSVGAGGRLTPAASVSPGKSELVCIIDTPGEVVVSVSAPVKNLPGSVSASDVHVREERDGEVVHSTKRARTGTDPHPRLPIATSSATTSSAHPTDSTSRPELGVPTSGCLDPASRPDGPVTETVLSQSRSTSSPATTTALSASEEDGTNSALAAAASSSPESMSGPAALARPSPPNESGETLSSARDINGRLLISFKKDKNGAPGREGGACISSAANQTTASLSKPCGRGRPRGSQGRKGRASTDKLVKEVVEVLHSWCLKGSPGARTAELKRAHKEQVRSYFDRRHAETLIAQKGYNLNSAFCNHRERILAGLEKLGHDVSHGSKLSGGPKYRNRSWRGNALKRTPHTQESESEEDGHGEGAGEGDESDTSGLVVSDDCRMPAARGSLSGSTAPTARSTAVEGVVQNLVRWAERGYPGSRTAELKRLDDEEGGRSRLRTFNTNRKAILERMEGLGCDVSEGSKLHGDPEMIRRRLGISKTLEPKSKSLQDEADVDEGDDGAEIDSGDVYNKSLRPTPPKAPTQHKRSTTIGQPPTLPSWCFD